MNQRFLAKLRNAMGIVALLCAMMSAQQASAQTFLPNNQAVQVVVNTLNNLNAGTNGQVSFVGGTVDKGNISMKVDANSVKGALFADYLKQLAVELKQGVSTGTAINNVYNNISNTQGFSSGSRAANLDAVKQMVIDLLS